MANSINIIPIKIIKDNNIYLDCKDLEQTKFIKNELKLNGKGFRTEPSTPNEIKDFLLKIAIEQNLDELICVMPTSLRSESYANTLAAMTKFIPEIRVLRSEKGFKGSVRVEVIDSQQVSAGLGLLLAEMILNLRKGIDVEKIIEKAKIMSNSLQSFLIPSELGQLYSQAAQKGDNSVGLGSYLLGSALDIKPIVFCHKGKTESVAKVRGFDKTVQKVFEMVISHIEKGTIKSKSICITYSGETKDLLEIKKFNELKEIADNHHIPVNLSKMSATMMVNIGLGGIVIAFASDTINIKF
jgi:DegV family protein with EDD domain